MYKALGPVETCAVVPKQFNSDGQIRDKGQYRQYTQSLHNSHIPAKAGNRDKATEPRSTICATHSIVIHNKLTVVLILLQNSMQVDGGWI